MDFNKLMGEFVPLEKLVQTAKKYNFRTENNYVLNFFYLGLKNGLSEYQAKSFASEMTLFLTGELVPTGTEFIYLEYKVDTHCQLIYEQLLQMYKVQSDEFWIRFRDYLLNFYKSVESWNFERGNFQLNMNLTDKELSLLKSLGCKSYRFAVRELLVNYDYDLQESFIPADRGTAGNITTAYIGVSENQLLMKVPHKDTTKKFLQIFYYYFSKK